MIAVDEANFSLFVCCFSWEGNLEVLKSSPSSLVSSTMVC